MADLGRNNALEKMERDFERSKAALLSRFLQDQEELALRLKNMGLRRHTTGDMDNSSAGGKEPGTRRSRPSRRREGVSRPKTALGNRTRRSKTVDYDDSNHMTVDDNDNIDVVDPTCDSKSGPDYSPTASSVSPPSTAPTRRLRPKTSVGFYERKAEGAFDSDGESDTSAASVASIAGGDDCTDGRGLEEQLSYEDFDDPEVSPGLRHSEHFLPSQYNHYHHHQQLIYRDGAPDDFEGVYSEGENEGVLRPQTSADSMRFRSSNAGVTCQEQVTSRTPSALQKRRGRDLNNSASLRLGTTNPLISIHQQHQTNAAKLGLSHATRVECDANLYKKLRNKSAPGHRHQNDFLGARKPISVYHLPPLDKGLVGDRGSGSNTPASAASFHGSATYIEANLK